MQYLRCVVRETSFWKSLLRDSKNLSPSTRDRTDYEYYSSDSRDRTPYENLNQRRIAGLVENGKGENMMFENIKSKDI